MGFSTEKPTTETGWAVAGIPLRAPLKPIYTDGGADVNSDGRESDEYCTTTPTSEGSRISQKLLCPPPPRKRRAVPDNKNGKMEFYVTPPDLEALFICRHVGLAFSN